MNQEKVGNFIANCRKEKAMTQVQFAEKLGVTNKSVSKWETGKCLPDAHLFRDICMILGISLNELFAGEKISIENKDEKFEETLLLMTKDYQRKDYKIITNSYIFIIILVITMAINLSVGGALLEGTPVLNNFLFSILSVVACFILSKLSRENYFFQKIIFLISTVVFISAWSAFALNFFDASIKVRMVIGWPCELVFYGARIFLDWMAIYAFAGVLSLANMLYTGKNIKNLEKS